MLQWVAMISMLFDHIGLVWFPDSPAWRVVGRLAFPIYGYYVTMGLARTRNRRMYLLRLGGLALLSQIPFTLLFNTWNVNVIGTFFVSVGTIYLMEKTSVRPLRYIWLLAAVVIMEVCAFDYGTYGLILMLIYRYTSAQAMLLAHAGVNFAYFILFQSWLQLFSLLPTLVFAFKPDSAEWIGYRTPRWLWRTFYPAHLLVLFMIAEILR